MKSRSTKQASRPFPKKKLIRVDIHKQMPLCALFVGGSIGCRMTNHGMTSLLDLSIVVDSSTRCFGTASAAVAPSRKTRPSSVRCTMMAAAFLIFVFFFYEFVQNRYQ